MSKKGKVIALLLVVIVVVGAYYAGHNHMLIPQVAPVTEEEHTKASKTEDKKETSEKEDKKNSDTDSTTKELEPQTGETIDETEAYEAALKATGTSEEDVEWHSQSYIHNWLYGNEFRAAYVVTFYESGENAKRHVLMIDATSAEVLEVIA